MIDLRSRELGVAVGALLASSTTLVCCALPAVMVGLGAGAALVGLLSAFPQLVWLSEHKVALFGIATIVLAAAGVVVWRARTLPCPIEARAARGCMQLRRATAVIYVAAAIAHAVAVVFAFILPLWST